jgi:formylglycine-generating enzyme required for sulfatase activity
MARRALILTTCHYEDPELATLSAPALDAEGLRTVLSDAQIGNFEELSTCHDRSWRDWHESIGRFFSGAGRDDLLLLYISGHAVKDRDGELCFAAADTLLRELLWTSVPASFIHRAAKLTLCRRIIIILDTCFSGAFGARLQARSGAQVNVSDHFKDSRGTVVITASDEVQHAWEDRSGGHGGRPSCFSRHLIEGLSTGRADLDDNGHIATEELYRYVLEQLDAETDQQGVSLLSHQQPQRWTFGLTGDLLVASNPIRPGTLPPEIIELIDSPSFQDRLQAVQRLGPLLGESEPRVRRAVRDALERLEKDQSPRVLRAAAAALHDDDTHPGKTSIPIDRDGGGCPEMAAIPPGHYLMGSPSTEPGRYDNEGPVHEVTIDYAFAVSRFPVTVAQWRMFVEATGRPARGRWLDPGFPQDDRHPVVCVTWHEAQEYVTWLTHRTRRPYRLLSEAELEYVNRARSRSAYFWGDSIDDLSRYANGNVPAVKARFPYTSPVGSFEPNAFGLHDITGNVWCWTNDTWHESYEGAPADGSPWTTGGSRGHVVRGGSLSTPPRNLRAACRTYATDPLGDVGFRVARADY